MASAYPAVKAEHHELGVFYLYAEPSAVLLFCENETNAARVWGTQATTQFPKDGIGDHLMRGADTVNPGWGGHQGCFSRAPRGPGRGQAAVM